jgi:hypothetical protein
MRHEEGQEVELATRQREGLPGASGRVRLGVENEVTVSQYLLWVSG